jgi:hypothetical protein
LNRCRFVEVSVYGPWDPTKLAASGESSDKDVTVSIHYELYDGLPCYGKWLTIQNGGGESITLNRYSSDLLAAVEHTSEVDELSLGKTPPNMHVETDMAFGGMLASRANRRSFRWLPDPDYHTQVNYEKKTPCLLEVGPDLGPDQRLAPGTTFESFRGWVLPFDSSDRERCGLSVRRMYRTLAPWATENPLMMHLVRSDEAAVRQAIDQCAEAGFEMLILSFGSGFDMETRGAGEGSLLQHLRPRQRNRDWELFAVGIPQHHSPGRRGLSSGRKTRVRQQSLSGQLLGTALLRPPPRVSPGERIHPAGA